MISRSAWYLRALLRQVWVRVALFAALAIVSAVLARVLSPYLPETVALSTGSEAVAQLLGVLTSSMLAVTTFSLSIAVSAFAAAAGTATPRATVLLQEDRTTQNVLATFLGAFLFGLVGLIALRADLYDASGKVVVFLFTVAVIGLVVVALIRWIDHLMEFGRMGDTLDRVERAATASLRKRIDTPYLGGRALATQPSRHAQTVDATETGYVQNIDMHALQERAEALGARVMLCRLPGAFVARGDPLMAVEGSPISEDVASAMARAVIIGNRRTFDEDPRFGLIALGEIASRALSPAVNDPGTAIDILGRLVRVLVPWRDADGAEIRFPDVFVPAITAQDFMEDAFRPIARDGAALSEVQIRLQKALSSLRQDAPGDFAAACERMAREALARAEAESLLPAELAAIRAAARLETPPSGAGDGIVAPRGAGPAAGDPPG